MRSDFYYSRRNSLNKTELAFDRGAQLNHNVAHMFFFESKFYV